MARPAFIATAGKIVLESLRGGERDFTAMGVRRAIILLSIPMVLEMAMESLFALVDVLFVSRLGVDAVATIGLTEGVMTLMYSVAWGLGAGITAVVARRVGEKDREGANVSAFQGVMVALVFGSCVSSLGVLFAPNVLHLMGASTTVVRMGTPFTRLMLGSNVLVLLLFGINAAFRGAGNAALAMRSLWLANAINIVLDPLLIFGWGPFPAMGLEGAALATIIGRGCGVGYQCWHLFDGRYMLRLARRHLRIVPPVLLNIVKVSGGASLQNIIASASWVFLVRIVASFGSDAVAGYTFAVRAIIFAMLPAWGLANAASTLVGQNLGAGSPWRAERSAWLCGHYNAAYMGAMALLFWCGAPWLMAVFTPDADVAAVGVEALRIICLGYCFFAYGMVLAQAFNGAGDAMTPVWLNFVSFWMVEIPLAFWLAHRMEGPEGVFIAIAFSESLLALLCVLVFRKGGWRTAKV